MGLLSTILSDSAQPSCFFVNTTHSLTPTSITTQNLVLANDHDTKFEPVNGDRRRVAYEKAVMPMNNKEKWLI